MSEAYDEIFAMLKKEMNFYEFAEYFKKLGCKNALYLDGFVSRTYLPEKNIAYWYLDKDFVSYTNMAEDEIFSSFEAMALSLNELNNNDK